MNDGGKLTASTVKLTVCAVGYEHKAVLDIGRHNDPRIFRSSHENGLGNLSGPSKLTSVVAKASSKTSTFTIRTRDTPTPPAATRYFTPLKAVANLAGSVAPVNERMHRAGVMTAVMPEGRGVLCTICSADALQFRTCTCCGSNGRVEDGRGGGCERRTWTRQTPNWRRLRVANTHIRVRYIGTNGVMIIAGGDAQSGDPRQSTDTNHIRTKYPKFGSGWVFGWGRARAGLVPSPILTRTSLSHSRA